MEFDLEDFVAQLSLDLCTKDSLYTIANHYEVAFSKQDKKQDLKFKHITILVERNVLPPVGSVTPRVEVEAIEPELRKLELQLEMWHKENELQLKERGLQQEFLFHS
ncbi:hypothetical protein NL108_011270 [Boleophthalmus pectinirostris]|nr:hypothetical protein NL108_011270 [Boleophthalmus pectinirostris]